MIRIKLLLIKRTKQLHYFRKTFNDNILTTTFKALNDIKIYNFTVQNMYFTILNTSKALVIVLIFCQKKLFFHVTRSHLSVYKLTIKVDKKLWELMKISGFLAVFFSTLGTSLFSFFPT